ncbi:MAG: 50S ribosomal protein L24 [Candidatus Omnitrophica bacterium]|nr:50S ribosomal protein L24 [Candidatus Omnitrophota bacterium]
MGRLKKGDLVQVLSGKERGKRGKILSVLPERHAALVERLNLAKHFERRAQADQPGGVIEREAPIPLEKLNVVCPRCGRATRGGVRLNQDGTRQRMCKRCGEVIG